jgi:sortase A
MTDAAKWLRRFELALMIAGISLLGGAIAATALRWDYQAKQEQAFARDEDRPAETPLALIRDDSPADQEVIDRSADPLAMFRIEIPRVGVRAIVREGVDDATLALAVGHIGGTARPGEIGNVVLAGHRDTFFRGLRNIRLDDRVRLDVPPNSYEYRVVSLEVVAPSETRVLDPTGGEELTLVTCHPFGFIGHAPNRFIVRAARVE